MAKVIGTVGSYSRKLIKRRKILRIISLILLGVAVFFIFYSLSIILFLKDYYYYFSELDFKYKLFLIFIAIFSVGSASYFTYELIDTYKFLKDIKRRLFGVERGLEAEKKVEGILNNLDDNYLIIHDIVFKTKKKKKANIDHLVIYKPKNLIFLLETKSVVNPSDKQIKYWYSFIRFYNKKLIEFLKEENLKNEVDYKIIPILLLPNSNIHKTISKIPISNGEKILNDIKRYSKAYKSYGMDKSIKWEEIFRKLKSLI